MCTSACAATSLQWPTSLSPRRRSHPRSQLTASKNRTLEEVAYIFDDIEEGALTQARDLGKADAESVNRIESQLSGKV